MVIGIIGLGYVGLTMAVTMAERGFHVVASEKNGAILRAIEGGCAHFFEIGLDRRLQKVLAQGKLKVGCCLPDSNYDAVVITVGTPLRKSEFAPEFQFVRQAIVDASEVIQEDTLVILRSTVAIGTTRNLAYPLLKRKFNSPLICFSPERTVEGKAMEELPTLPQAIGAIDERSMEKAVSIFRKITPMIIELPALEEAEFVKLIDNVYRDVRFAFSNQMALLAESLGLDGNRVIQAANNGYPRTEVPLPGYVGGPCLSKDPYILAHSFQNGDASLALEARRINRRLPTEVVRQCVEELRRIGKDLQACKLFLSGFAFKGVPETDDLRDSPSLIILDEFKKISSCIYGHDFVVKTDSLAEIGVTPVSIEDGFHDADLVLVMNNHPAYRALDINSLIQKAKEDLVFYDSWRMIDYNSIDEQKRIRYAGLGLAFAARTNAAVGSL